MANWWEERDRMTDTGLTVGQLFEKTYPGQGQQVWEQQSGMSLPPPAPGEARSTPVQGVTTQVTPTYSPPSSTSYVQGRSTPVQGATTQVTPTYSQSEPTVYPPGSTEGGTSGQTIGVVDPNTGMVQYVKPEDVERVKATYQQMREEAQRRQAEDERLKQFQAETQRIAAEGQKAYQQAMIQYQNAEMAQRAADNAMQREIKRSEIMQQGIYQQGLVANQMAANQGTEQYRGQLIALQQQQANQERRARRPYRSLRVKVA